MQNVTMKVTGKKLVIEVDLTKDFGVSKSGKSQVIATTSGNVTVKDDIKIGLNIYRPALVGVK
jgi:hypothetical protein